MRKSKSFFLYLLILVFTLQAAGCEAFSRKFRRKKKQAEIIEPILTPQDKVGLFYDNQTKYKNYFVYWRAWQDELIQAMSGASLKRRKYCLKQAMENLQLMADLLKDEFRENIDNYLEQMKNIRNQLEIAQTIKDNLLLKQLSDIRRAVNNNLYFAKVKDWIKN